MLSLTHKVAYQCFNYFIDNLSLHFLVTLIVTLNTSLTNKIVINQYLTLLIQVRLPPNSIPKRVKEKPKALSHNGLRFFYCPNRTCHSLDFLVVRLVRAFPIEEKVYKIWLDYSVGKQTQQQLSIKYDYSPRTIRQY